ncbi:Fibrocystin-L, partial [Tetrabaena socialis]
VDGGAPAVFRYLSPWSSGDTWPLGRPPVAGESVVVAPGSPVLLDVSPPDLASLVVLGELLFDEGQPSLELRAHAIIVTGGGSLAVGSEAAPYGSNATITLLGQPADPGLPLYGTKVLAVRHGSVRMYGMPKAPHYATLNATADPGDLALLVNGPLNWKVGDRIVVASSSFLADEVDEAALTSIANTSTPGVVRLGLDRALSYTHLGEVLTAAPPPWAQGQQGQRPSQPLDMRAVVAVLSRNVVVQGDEASAAGMFGGQVLVHSPPNLPRASLQLDSVELRRMGQAFAPSRHALQWHLHGDASASGLRGCVVHTSYARAAVVHGTRGVVLRDSVSYNVYGNAFALEDGSEAGNVVDGVVGVLTRASPALAYSDATPATFLVTNPNNTYRCGGGHPVRSPAAARRVVGVATHSPAPGSPFTAAPLALLNLTFYNYSATAAAAVVGDAATSRLPYQQHYALEACARCRAAQGGATTLTAGFQFWEPAAAQAPGAPAPRPALTYWSWPHQGVYEDTDGSLLSAAALAPYLDWRASTSPSAAAAAFPATGPWAGATWHSATGPTSLHDPADCLLLVGPTGQPTTNAGAVCAPRAGPSRRLVVNELQPPELVGRDLVVVDSVTNRSVAVAQSDWNEGGGYVVALRAGREYWLQWRTGDGARLDAIAYKIQATDALTSTGQYLYITTKYIQQYDQFTTNRRAVTASARPLPLPGTAHGAASYNNTLAPNTWRWRTAPTTSTTPTAATAAVVVTAFNDTALTTYLSAAGTASVRLAASACPPAGCDSPPPQLASQPERFLRWSSDATWAAAAQLPGGAKPQAGDNVTIPVGWAVLLDESPPPLGALVVRGSLAFDPGQDLELRAAVVLVVGQGSLSAGSPSRPHPRAARILLTGGSDSPGWTLEQDAGPGYGVGANVGSKVLAVLGGGSLDLHGRPLAKRWTRLAFAAAPGDRLLRIAEPFVSASDPDDAATDGGGEELTAAAPSTLGWAPGGRLVVTSTSYNQYQAEVRYIVAILPCDAAAVAETAGGGGGGTGDAGGGNCTAVVLDRPLAHPHGARTPAFAPDAAGAAKGWSGGGLWADLRAEVALLSSNVVLAAAEEYDGVGAAATSGAVVDSSSGSSSGSSSSSGTPTALEGLYGSGVGGGAADAPPPAPAFGARLLVSGLGSARLGGVSIEHCGQPAAAGAGGAPARPCVAFDALLQSQAASPPPPPVQADSLAPSGGSYLDRCAVVGALGGGSLVVSGGNDTAAAAAGVGVYGSVMYGSYGASNVQLLSGGNTLYGNLALGTVRAAAPAAARWGPANFLLAAADNVADANVAAGSDRFGFVVHGQPCAEPPPPGTTSTAGPTATSTATTDSTAVPFRWSRGSFSGNVAHGCLAGLWLRSSAASRAAGRCTQLAGFTAHTNWDFGVITMRGIDTDVRMYDLSVLDNKAVGVAVLRASGFASEHGAVSWRGGLLAGRSSPDVCALCAAPSDPGCHQRPSPASYGTTSTASSYDNAALPYNSIAAPYGPSVGLRAASFAGGFSAGPDYDGSWAAATWYGSVFGETAVSGVLMADFGGEGCAGGSFALASHLQAAPDAFHPVSLANVSLLRVVADG